MSADQILRGLPLAQIRNLPALLDVTPAAAVLGVSRSNLYESIKNGSCPVKTIRVNRRIKVLTASLIRVLELEDDGAARPGKA